jgi:MSHA pilin protein MshA
MILGILAATALARFADMGADARRARMAAARGAVASAVALVRAKWVLNGTTAARTVTVDGQALKVHANGWLEGNMIATAAGLDAVEYTVAASTLTTVAHPDVASCRFTYIPATGTVGVAPAPDAC